jgi:TrmH family RNA methyltransferase
MSYFIESQANPKIKNLIKLQKPRERKKQGVVLVEGYKEVTAALKSGWKMSEVFYCAEYGGENPSFFGVNKNEKMIVNVSREVFEKISLREKPDGYLAVFLEKKYSLDNLVLQENPLIIVLEGMEKPGNFGAILRTSDAAGVDLIIVNDPQLDIYHPQAIRSSLGAIFNKKNYFFELRRNSRLA